MGPARLTTMPLTHSPHLIELLTRFYEIGRERYSGRIYDNVLNIFEEMDIEDQKALLRGTLGIYAALCSPLIHEREVIDRGDYDALLMYLKRTTEESRKEAEMAEKRELDNAVPQSTEKTMDDRFTTIVTWFIGFLAIFICGHLLWLALDSDPEAMGSAKIYLTIFEMIMQ